MNKCPKCERSITRMDVDAMFAHAGTTKYKAITFTCPFCHTVVGAQIDPLAVSADLQSALKKS